MFRELRSYEPGTESVGLVGVSYPEDFSSISEDSRVLVTIRDVNAPPESYLLTGPYGQLELVNSEDFVHSIQPDPVAAARRSRWLSVTLYTVLVLLLATIGFAGLTGAVSLRVVLTGSMVPTINPGDVILTVNDTFVQPKQGDIVVYTGKTFDGKTVASFAHRIIGGNAVDGWIVQGDANPQPDTQHPTANDIESVVVLTIPQIGRFLNAQTLLLIAVAAFGIWLIVDGVRRRER
jgi:signal peptidase I